MKQKINLNVRPVIKNLGSGYSASVRLGADNKPLNFSSGELLKLDSGENVFAPPLRVDWQKVARELPLYPESGSRELRAALAKIEGVTPDMVITSNGSDELIDLIGRIFLEPGRTLVDFTPTFPMFAKFAQLSGCLIKNVPRRADFQLDLPASVAALKQADLAFLANPNNPTGTMVPQADIIALLQTGKPVVVDEAYFEFSGETVLPLLAEFPNLIVLRTFSKWAGIASVRIGWGVASPEIIGMIDSIRAPYNVSGVAQEVALTALRQREELLGSVKDICEGRDWFVDQMQGNQDWEVFPSKASCITLVPRRGLATEAVQQLSEQGILVKALSLPGLGNALRISAGPTSVMQRVLDGLQSLANDGSDPVRIG